MIDVARSFPPWFCERGGVVLVLLLFDVFGAASSLDERRLHVAGHVW